MFGQSSWECYTDDIAKSWFVAGIGIAIGAIFAAPLAWDSPNLIYAGAAAGSAVATLLLLVVTWLTEPRRPCDPGTPMQLQSRCSASPIVAENTITSAFTDARSLRQPTPFRRRLARFLGKSEDEVMTGAVSAPSSMRLFVAIRELIATAPKSARLIRRILKRVRSSVYRGRRKRRIW
ncbi:MAG: hypothetical protein AAFX06_30580 [Planctomycetota bacterium]